MENGPTAGRISRDQALRALEFWHKVEFFHPYDLDSLLNNVKKRTYCFTRSSLVRSDLPWRRDPLNNTSNEYALTHCWLYLGIFDTKDIERVCHSCRLEEHEQLRTIEDQQRGIQQTCFVRLKAGRDGRPDLNNVSVSTLPWALNFLERNALGELSSEAFQTAKRDLNRRLQNLLSDLNRPGEPDEGSLRSEDLARWTDTLFDWANFHPHEQENTERPLLAIEEVWSKIKPVLTEANKRKGRNSVFVQPEPVSKVDSVSVDQEDEEEEEPDGIEILNSFYLEDLQHAIRLLKAGSAPLAVEHYLEGNTTNQLDLYSTEGRQTVYEQLRPELHNRGRWLENADRQMSLMQQFSINTALEQLKDGGVYSINGPPGTGKTTTQKDLIAENVVRRAHALAQLEHPEQAFRAERVNVQLGESFSADNVALLNESLTGFEMVMASSNNAAVENVSKDFPRSLGEEWAASAYLQPIARKVAALREDGSEIPLKDEEMPWGLISAVLGKKANRHRFAQRFYYDPELKGSDALKQRRAEGKYLNIRDWARAYSGPDFAEAKRAFRDAESSVAQHMASLQGYAEHHKRFAYVSEAGFTIAEQRKLCDATTIFKTACDAIAKAEKQRANFSGELRELKEDERLIGLKKPSRWKRFFALPGAREHLTEVQENARAQLELRRAMQKAAADLESTLRVEYLRAKIAFEDAQAQLNARRREFCEGQQRLHQFERQHNVQTPPEDLASIESPERQLHAPWQNERLNRLRSELFAAALQLHEAWLAYVVRTPNLFGPNCVAIAKLLDGEMPAETTHVLPIWQSLFMIVPVISTTFASFHRMFDGLPVASLGWLFADEAGQAVPQALPGALCKAKRALVMGDPMQIEPIFGVAIRLIELLANHDRELIDRFGPHRVSAQTLADRANRFGTWIGSDEKIWTGSPLRIHRRCSEPMFTVANSIAYENRMIQGKSNAEESGSRWFHVPGPATDLQYVPDQGRFMMEQILSRYVESSAKLPAVYIISPFRRVAENLRRHLANPDEWRKCLPVGLPAPKKTELRKWAAARIGTVHTFQGKEEDEVFFVLGADKQSPGSAAWAAGKPNLLNVALTRARHRIYLVGDRELWGEQKHFNQLAGKLRTPQARTAATVSSSQV